MFTAQRLFRRSARPEALLRHTPFLERARTEQEHGNHNGSRAALSAYLTARLVDRWCALRARTAHNDGFRWQLDSTRKFVQELPDNSAEGAHLTAIVDAVESASPESYVDMRMSITAYSYFLEHEGRLEESLDIMLLAAQTYLDGIPADEFARTALFVARLNRLLAQWDDAVAAFSAAEAAAKSDPPPENAREVLQRCRLGRANVLRGQGDLAAALKAVQRVIKETDAPEDRHVQAAAYADLGAIYDRQGLKIEAVEAIYEAFIRTEDAYHRMRTLGDLGIALSAVGANDAARLAFEVVLDSRSAFLVRVNALVELMEMDSAVGNRIAFERSRHDAELYTESMPPSMAVDYRYKAGLGLLRFGQVNRGRFLWEQGRALAEEHGLNDWFIKLDQALIDYENDPTSVQPTAPLVPQVEHDPRVERLTEGLRQFAETQAQAG